MKKKDDNIRIHNMGIVSFQRILSFCIIMGGMAGIQACKKAPSFDLEESSHDLVFDDLAGTWDEGLPLGNSIIGALVWQKEKNLRLSLDRIDLWDLRPTEFVESDIFRFKWIEEQIQKNDYGVVQQKLDAPYNALPGPSKIPGAALEFDSTSLGRVVKSQLYLKGAIGEVTWEKGARLQTFVHAERPIGYFMFEGVDETFEPILVPPVYNSPNTGSNDNSHAGADLDRLGYSQGTITRGEQSYTYHQPCWGDFSYEVSVKWQREGDRMYGAWAITSSLVEDKASDLVARALSEGLQSAFRTHEKWWTVFWSKSSITLPDPVLEKQYYNEIYKLGSTAREYSYPISLQAVWTADNGKLPPWKGDYHHDLNTQLSYWPCYIGNYLTEGMGYLNTLWNQKETNRKYTQKFFEVSGINVPGVCTLLGEPMGGWVQYSCSPTISAWLAQHFYLHWRYSADRVFLEEKGYPYLREVATFLENFSTIKEGKRQLPLGSSPEIYDNGIKAWFKEPTNYDLSLMSFTFKAASEMAHALGKDEEAGHWSLLGSELPAFDTDETGALTFARNEPYRSSHRHFSHAMAVHPIGNVDWENGEEDQKIIRATIEGLDKYGPGAWTGYSYSWLGNMKARARDGEGAARALRDFAECFCLRNTFHVNGDQSGTGKSGFTYRPFTLEGNFAFASGIQEMLIQSHTGTVRLFPAIPASWQDVSFRQLRTYGAFLVTAERKKGVTSTVSILSEKGGLLKLENPFPDNEFKVKGARPVISGKTLEWTLKAGEKIELGL